MEMTRSEARIMLMKLLQQYHELGIEQKKLREERAALRANINKLGAAIEDTEGN